jgi:hypothetical protein
VLEGRTRKEPYFGERPLIRCSHRLVVDGRVPERGNHRILMPLSKTAQRIVGLLVGELVWRTARDLCPPLGCNVDLSSSTT